MRQRVAVSIVLILAVAAPAIASPETPRRRAAAAAPAAQLDTPARPAPAPVARRFEIDEPEPEIPAGAIVFNSLADVERAALAPRPSLAALEAELAAARAALMAARLAGAYPPVIEAGVGRRSQGEAGRDENFTDWGLGVAREFEISGQAERRRAAARREIELAEIAAAARRWEIAREARAAFRAARLAAEEVRIAGLETRVRRRLAEAARERFEAGAASRLETLFAEAEAARAVAAETAAGQAATDALARLALAVGSSPNVRIAVRNAPESIAAFDVEALVATALARHEIRLEAAAAALADARAELALAEGTPNVTVGGMYEREERTTDVVSVRLSVPLPLVNRGRGEATRARSEAEASRARVEAMRRATEVEVRGLARAITVADERATRLEREAVARLKEGMALVIEAYEAGALRLAEVSLHVKDALDGRRAALQARRDLAEALGRLEIAIGESAGEATGGARE